MNTYMKTALVALLIVTVASCRFTINGPEKEVRLTVAADTAVVKYQCPMKCEGDTSYTTAGTCPVCKMDLEKQ